MQESTRLAEHGAAASQGASDAPALEEALRRELQMTGHYQDVIESTAVDTPARSLMVLFQRHHVEHCEALTSLLTRQGINAPLLQSHSTLGAGGETPGPQHNAMASLAQREQACSDDYSERAARCAEPAHLRALVRLATQCAARAGALTHAAGNALEIRTYRL